MINSNRRDRKVRRLKFKINFLIARQGMALTTKRTFYFCIMFVLCSSCLGKSCTKDENCGIWESCCLQNSGVGQCARSCTIGKACTSDRSCGSSEFCCVSKTGGRQCLESCTVDKSCITNQDCAANEQCCGSDIKTCTRHCLPNKEACIKDQDCLSGQCCDNGTCTKECDKNAKDKRNWTAAYGAFICIIFVCCFCIGCCKCKCRCRKAREAEASRQTTHEEATHRVIRGTIDLENQLRHQYYTEQEPSDSQNRNPNHHPPSYPNQPPPPYTDHSLPANQSTTPAHNESPPPYLDQLPPAYQASV